MKTVYSGIKKLLPNRLYFTSKLAMQMKDLSRFKKGEGVKKKHLPSVQE